MALNGTDPGFTYDPIKGIVPRDKGPVGGKSPDVRGGSLESYPNEPRIYDNPPPGQGSQIPTDGTTNGANLPMDWSSMLGLYGLPADVQAKVNSIFAQTNDVNQATALALAYIRGTSWYAHTYPGIQEGLANGTVSNEADYRSYLNNVNILAHQYLGRDISGQEVADYLKQGFNVDRIGRVYAGAAIANTNSNEWQYVAGAFDENGRLSDTEKTALGQEQAGIDSALGQRVQQRLARAQQRMEGVFRGSLATTGLGTSQSGGLVATTLGKSQAPDVAA